MVERVLSMVKSDAGNHVLRVSEMFSSIQGEGASAGSPSVFVRLAVCNLRCRWCDTKYTWDFRTYEYESEVKELGLGNVVERLTALLEEPDPSQGGLGRRLVITGGEPLLQQACITSLLERLPKTLVVEVETNGTICPSVELRARINQWNVSPKLSNSGDPESVRIRPRVLQTLKETGRAWLKLVIGSPGDLEEADELVRKTEWPRERTLLMPQASDPATLAERMPLVADAALTRGFRVSPRLHIERFGGVRGR